MQLINGVPAEQYGVWCRHGKRILAPDPADTSDYPRCIPADPWPCSEASCSLAQYEADMEEEAAQYEAERWQEYYDGILPIPGDLPIFDES